MAADPRAINYDLACIIKSSMNEVRDEIKALRLSAEVGFENTEVRTYKLVGDGTIRKIVDTDAKPRRVQIIVAPRTDLGDAVLAIAPVNTVSPDAGPVYATGTAHDFGIIPPRVELYAAQKPAIGATASDLTLWVMISI
jgi:hypothetical protein